MPGPHYALSEALIVAAAIWAGLRLTKFRLPLAALGVGILGLAAGIGVYRFGTGQIELLAGFHRDFSQIGGAIAMGLIATQLLLQHPICKDGKSRRWIPALCLGGTAFIALAAPQLTTALFVGWLAVAMLAAAVFPGHSLLTRTLMLGFTSIFLLNVLLVRRSPLLEADLSWHLFHLLVAAWLIAIVWVFGQILGAGASKTEL